MRALTLLRWFISQTVRNACAAHKHYHRLLEAEKDILPADAIIVLRAKLQELHLAIRSGLPGEMNLKMQELRAVATEHLVACPHPGWREGMEVILVALAVALAIRTFFLQPFKIPSGSMQPTLSGINTLPDFTDAISGLDRISSGQFMRPRIYFRIQNEYNLQKELQKNLVVPRGWERFKEWIKGDTYIYFQAPTNGMIEAIPAPWPGTGLNLCQEIKFAGVWYTIWFPPDCGDDDLRHRAGLIYNRPFHQGDVVIKLKVGTGDHLLVDRLSYNFVRPERGDILVFSTENTQIHDPDEDYIKRLVVMPGEHVQIGDDRHVVINGHRLDASTPHFEKVYGFDPTQPPRDNEYSGHLNGVLAREYRIGFDLAPLFPTADTIYTNGPDSYMFMGDNTCDSSDSRNWGQVPTENVIGQAFFVYWPFTSRFGLNHD